MKSIKLLLLLGLLTLTGCNKDEDKDNTSNQETPASDVTRDEDKEKENNSTETPSNNTDENNENNDNVEENSNTTTENNNNGEENTDTENNQENNNNNEENTSTEQEASYTISLFNTPKETYNKADVNVKLKAYINSIKPDLVESLESENCQMANNIPANDNKVFIIGTGSGSGYLNFTCSSTIKKLTITAETYNKPYTDKTGYHANIDTDSELCITPYQGETTTVDLKPVEEQPVEKTFDVAINNTQFKLFNTETKGRVLLKSITFVL